MKYFNLLQIPQIIFNTCPPSASKATARAEMLAGVVFAFGSIAVQQFTGSVSLLPPGHTGPAVARVLLPPSPLLPTLSTQMPPTRTLVTPEKATLGAGAVAIFRVPRTSAALDDLQTCWASDIDEEHELVRILDNFYDDDLDSDDGDTVANVCSNGSSNDGNNSGDGDEYSREAAGDDDDNGGDDDDDDGDDDDDDGDDDDDDGDEPEDPPPPDSSIEYDDDDDDDRRWEYLEELLTTIIDIILLLELIWSRSIEHWLYYDSTPIPYHAIPSNVARLRRNLVPHIAISVVLSFLLFKSTFSGDGIDTGTKANPTTKVVTDTATTQKEISSTRAPMGAFTHTLHVQRRPTRPREAQMMEEVSGSTS
ncbi:hypothetical protein H0H87_011474 [Tephrocybe sp. NHM501043]|nr:hypothetical protein H0H87_011474 [Tephrocybe sp. NHM501043]